MIQSNTNILCYRLCSRLLPYKYTLFIKIYPYLIHFMLSQFYLCYINRVGTNVPIIEEKLLEGQLKITFAKFAFQIRFAKHGLQVPKKRGLGEITDERVLGVFFFSWPSRESLFFAIDSLDNNNANFTDHSLQSWITPDFSIPINPSLPNT